MPRAYPKEAFAIGNQNRGPGVAGVPPPTSYNQPPNGQSQPQVPTQHAVTPQFFNPQAVSGVPVGVPTINTGFNPVSVPTPTYSTVPAGQPVSYATSTTVATAPSLEPLQATSLTSTFNQNTQQMKGMPPPSSSAVPTTNPVHTGPRHAPPPSGTEPTTTNATLSNPPYQQSLAPPTKSTMMRGKRPVVVDHNPSLASRSPSLSEYGGSMPRAVPSQPVNRKVDLASASPTPDPAWNANPAFVTTSLQSWPATTELLDKTGLPFSITFHPLAESAKEVPVINFPTECGIIRCKRCRTYVNPYVAFIDGGKRWKCNLCYYFNDVPREYFSIVGVDGRRYDHAQRPELNNAVVDFVASPEFMHRPPQPPVYFFVIDVSHTAIVSGMLQSVCNSILQAIKQKLSKNERTKVGFVTVDSSIHFYNLRSDLSSPQMIVAPEIDTPLTPNGENLLVNLGESMPLVEILLTDLIPKMFQHSQDTSSAFGPAMHCAYKIMAPYGGKLLSFLSTLPSSGPGKLPNREATTKDPTMRALLRPGDQYYKNLALEMSKVQIGCDLFFFAPKFIDVASIGCLSKFTGGEVNYYGVQQNNVANEISRLQNDVFRVLTRNTGFEALMRVRCSKGLSIDSHHGSFFLRAQDLLTLPNVDSDKSFTFKLKISDAKNYLSTKNLARDGQYYATVQAGLLYTTFNGERRIRIVSKCCNITDQVTELYRQVDERACITLIGKLAMAKATEDGIPKAAAAVKSASSNILSKYAAVSGPAAPNAGATLMLPNTLLRFPLFSLAVVKNAIFRTDTKIDRRVSLMFRFETLSDEEVSLWIHPNLYNLANIPPEVGVLAEPFIMPPVLDLSSEKLDQRGIFLLDDGLRFMLWVGSAVDPNILQAVFGIQSMAQVDATNAQLQIIRLENEFSQRVNNVLDRLRSGRSGYTWLYPMREKDPHERDFFSKLIQDRFPDSYSYREYILELKNSVSSRR